MKTSLTLLFALSAFGLMPVALANPGDLCTKTETTFAGGNSIYGYYHVKYNRGNDATVGGSQCLTLPDGSENCFPVYGEMIADNGMIELTTSASDELTIAPFGKLSAFSIRHWQINPETMTGTATSVSSQIVSGKIEQVVDTGKVTVIPCSKATPQDRENVSQLKKFRRDAGRLK